MRKEQPFIFVPLRHILSPWIAFFLFLPLSLTISRLCLFLWFSFCDSHLSGSLFLSLSLSFSLPLYDYWKLYGDSARAPRRAADAIGWLALHPHSWLAAGLNIGFNQLGGSVCRSVYSDASRLSLSPSLLPSSTTSVCWTGCCVNWPRSNFQTQWDLRQERKGGIKQGS